MAKGSTAPRTVRFAPDVAQEVIQIRAPRDDELSVMLHFAKHATRCSTCIDPYAAHKKDIPLCNKGHSLARDVAKYIYSKGGRPFSLIDKENGERSEIKIPEDCAVIHNLVKAFGRGMSLERPKPVIHPAKVEKVEKYEKVDRVERVDRASYHPSRPTEYYVDDRPREPRYRQDAYNLIEVVPASSRRDRRERIYHGDRVQERYHYERKQRPVSYIETKGSLYKRDEEEKRRRQHYEEQPVVFLAEPGQRYHLR